MKDLMPTITSVDNCFHDGNPATGEQGTRVTAQFLNDVQDHIRDVEAELKYVLSKAGLNPNDAKTTQVYDAIIAIINANRRSASTTSKGEVQLTDSINMASSVFGASAFAVKTAYDKAVDGVNKANAAQTAANNANGNANTRAAAKNIVTNLDTLAESCFFGCYDNAVGLPADIVGTNQDLNGIHANAGYQKFQILSINGNDIRYRMNDDGNSWSSWTKLGFDSDIINAQNTANRANDNANSRLPAVGGEVQRLSIKATSGWSGLELQTKNGFWRLEAHPDSENVDDRRVNLLYRKGGDSYYLAFPAIGSGDIVAYQSWVNSNYLKNSGGTVTGDIKVNRGDWSSISCVNSANNKLMLEVSGDGYDSFGSIIYRTNTGSDIARLSLPKKTGDIVLNTDFTQSLNANGWTKLPNGLILQWGEFDTMGTKSVFNFPIPFPNRCFRCYVSDVSYTDSTSELTVRDFNTNGVKIYPKSVGVFCFFAIGN